MKTYVHPLMKDYLGFCLMKVGFNFKARLEEGLKDFGLVGPQGGILLLISKLGPLTQIEIVQQLVIDKATMVRLLDDLEKKEYVLRESHKTDRRAKVLKLTKMGEKIVAKSLKLRAQAEEDLLKDFSAADKKKFKELIGQLIHSDIDFK